MVPARILWRLQYSVVCSAIPFAVNPFFGTFSRIPRLISVPDNVVLPQFRLKFLGYAITILVLK